MGTRRRRSAALALGALVAGGLVVGAPAAQGTPAGPPDGDPVVGATAFGRRQEQANKALVVDAYSGLFNEGDLALIDSHWRSDYIQHNPQAPDGSAVLRQLVSGLRTQFPQAHLDIRRAVAQGDLVLVHSNLVLQPGTAGSAVVDVFRVEDGKIAEHWDVVQAVPATTASGNTMFSTLSSPRVDAPLPFASTATSRRIALGLFNRAVVGQDLSAVDRYVGEPYYQHDPAVADGAAAAEAALAARFDQFPQSSVEAKRVIAEGDLVAVHSHYRNGPDDRGSAVVDLFRVRRGKVVEHWNVAQPVPATSANDNTMF